MLGYSVSENGVQYVIKERTYNGGYLATIKCKNTRNIFQVKVTTGWLVRSMSTLRKCGIVLCCLCYVTACYH